MHSVAIFKGCFEVGTPKKILKTRSLMPKSQLKRWPDAVC